MIVGGGLLALGGIVFLVSKTGIPIGKLPGDISIQKPGFSLYVPITSMLILSVILTLLSWLVGAFRR